MSRNSREFDVVVWGCTGYTGRLVCEYLLKNYGPSGEKVRYAFGGRSQPKIDEVVQRLRALNEEVTKTPTILGDSMDRSSMMDLAKRTKCVCSLVGPYEQFGEKLVAACAESGTNYVDLTAEFGFMRRMIYKYNRTAEENQCKIIHSCGFDSVPSDLAVWMMQKYAQENYKESLVFARFALISALGGFSGGTVHSLSGLHDLPAEQQRRFSRGDYLVDVQSEAGLDLPPQDGPMVASQPLDYDEDLKIYTAPFLMAPANTKVVYRTAHLLEDVYGKEFEYQECQASSYKITGALSKGFTRVAESATSLSLVRKLLKWWLPQGSGPWEITRKRGYFSFQGVGRTKAVDGAAPKKVFVRVASDCGDPGYTETSKMLAEAALSASVDDEKCPKRYGVITPASGLDGILLERLKAAGMKFDVSDSPFSA